MDTPVMDRVRMDTPVMDRVWMDTSVTDMDTHTYTDLRWSNESISD